MRTTSWGWRPARPEGIWKHGCKWAKPLTAAAPWVTLALLLVMFALIEGRLTAAPGLVFDLPEPIAKMDAAPELAAVVVPVVREGASERETLVFFDDARYSLADEASVEAFRDRLAERVSANTAGTLLLLADSRVPSGHMMRLAGLAREAGIAHVQVAEKRE